MSRSVALAVVLVVGVLAGPATAAPRTPPPRTVEAPYTVSGVGGVLRGTFGAQGQSGGAVLIPLKAHERFAYMKLVDDSGMTVGADVGLDLDGDGLADVFLESFCGKTEGGQKIPPFQDAVLIVYPVIDQCGTAATTPTRGIATITLTAK